MADNDTGFEFTLPGEDDATFFPYAINTGGKDLKIIDALTELPLQEYLEASQDAYESRRGPMILALIGMSIRAKHPDWTAGKIIRIVENLNLEDVDFVFPDAEENGAVPPTEPSPVLSTGTSSSEDSSPSATPTPPSGSETSSETPA